MTAMFLIYHFNLWFSQDLQMSVFKIPPHIYFWLPYKPSDDVTEWVCSSGCLYLWKQWLWL